MILSVYCSCGGNSTVFCTSESQALVIATQLYIYEPVKELQLRYLNSIRDLLAGRQLSLCHQRNACRCRLHYWNVHHSDPESEASQLFSVGLGLPELVSLNTVTSPSQ